MSRANCLTFVLFIILMQITPTAPAAAPATAPADDAQAKQAMRDRWLQLARMGERNEVINQTTPILAGTSDPNERIELLYVRAEAMVWPPAKLEPGLRAAEQFIRAAPKDERGAELLYFLAEGLTSIDKQLELYRRASAGPYTSAIYGRLAKGRIVQTEGIGKPFELSFTD